MRRVGASSIEDETQSPVLLRDEESAHDFDATAPPQQQSVLVQDAEELNHLLSRSAQNWVPIWRWNRDAVVSVSNQLGVGFQNPLPGRSEELLGFVVNHSAQLQGAERTLGQLLFRAVERAQRCPPANM